MHRRTTCLGLKCEDLLTTLEHAGKTRFRASTLVEIDVDFDIFNNDSDLVTRARSQHTLGASPHHYASVGTF